MRGLKKIRPDFQEMFDQSEQEFLDDLRQLIRIPSVNGEKTYQAPFGIGPKRALEYLLELSEKLGFRTGQVADCVGWAEYGPEATVANDYFGVLGHADVVDVVDDWNYPPFDLSIKDGYMYGRGVLDNKGPLMAALLALYLIKKQNIPLKKRVRIMFGTDEEMGSRDISKFLKVEKPPYGGFTPDCKFPIVYGERGILDLTISQSIKDGSLKQIDELSGVFDRSFLPDYASVTILGNKLEFHGKKAPSNAPDLADNVLPKLVESCTSLDGQIGQVFDWINQSFGHQTNCQGLGIDYHDDDSGDLQLSLYEINIVDDSLEISFSLRYPVTFTETTVLNQIRSRLMPDMNLMINRSFPSVVKDKDLPFMQKFSKIYEADTGLDGTPVTTTGATYARKMPNIVAFGPSFPGQKGIAHKGDEWMKYSDWQMIMQIYYDCLLSELT